MEQKNDTKVFNQEDKNKANKNNAGKMAGAAVGGGIAGAAAMNAFAQHESEPNSETPPPSHPESEEKPEANPAPEQEPAQQPPSQPAPTEEPVEPEQTPEPKPTPKQEQDSEQTPKPEPEPEPEPNPEPVVPFEEIDPNDIDLADVIEDVTNVEIVYDVNGNEMVIATAHNSTNGEFYLVDADMDGDFDVVLDSTGVPLAELTGENDRLITVTDIEQKMTDDYIPPTKFDEEIAQNNITNENDIIVVDGDSSIS